MAIFSSFGCLRATFGPLQGVTLTQLILITDHSLFRPKGHWEHCSEVGPPIPDEGNVRKCETDKPSIWAILHFLFGPQALQEAPVNSVLSVRASVTPFSLD